VNPQVPIDHELTMRRDFLLKRAIDRRAGDLIKAGSKAVSRLKPTGKKSEMEESQLRNLLSVASEALSVDVVTNFIRYQIGRSPTADKWGCKPNDFGPTLIHDIESGAVWTAAQQVDREVQERIGGAPIPSVVDGAHLFLTRLYIGYLNRLFVYCKRREDNNCPDAWDNLFRETVAEERR
jgi:hypothetical protein